MATELHSPPQTRYLAVDRNEARHDPACLLWLGGRQHLCRSEGGGPLEADGGSCATWERVQLARRFAAAQRQGSNDQQADAVDETLALLAEVRHLLTSAAPSARTPERLAHTWTGVAAAFLRADQAVALAGWCRPAQ